jgi:nitroimidazol reductase NimA-like FMN-containing flavoprotein (pyridoxamine 5'-phosphate oxidase superfamily)
MDNLLHGEIFELARRNHVGHLGFADAGKAYVVPVFYAFDGRAFYFHLQPGQKDRFLDSTLEACLAITEAHTDEEWASILAFGRPEVVRDETTRLAAMEALLQAPFPPEWGITGAGTTRRKEPREVRLVRLVPQRMTGRRSAPARGAESWPSPR